MFNVGDVVRMKTGGRKMIVTKTVSPNRVEVAWMSKANIICAVLDQSLLEPDVGNGTILKILEQMMKTLADLKAQVEAQATVEQSIITLLNGLSQKIKDAGTDQAALDAISADLDQQQQTMLDAIKANTPAVPPPAPEPTPAT